MTITTVDIGVFAHNEAAGIGAMLAQLAQQTILQDPQYSVRIWVLANGCTDGTVPAARAQAAAFPHPAAYQVLDLAQGGKSRTWNAYVHQHARPDADVLVFCDADIALPQASAVARLVDFLHSRPDVDATSSLPVKDIDYFPQRLGLIERLIGLSGAGMDRVRTAICGQLYAMRGSTARTLQLPVGLPVEDGFVRHALITQQFGAHKDASRIDKPNGVMHVYASERRILPLLRHQTRVIVGGAINAALFARLVRVRSAAGERAVHSELTQAAADAQWLQHVLREELPQPRYGWVPWPFLLARTRNTLRNGRRTPRRVLLAAVAFTFDLVVYVLAQAQLARGKGAGYW